MRKTLFILTLAALASLAFAQELPDASFDPAAWFTSSAALAAAVVAFIAFIKQNVVKLDGWLTIAASFGVSIVVAVVGSFTSFYDATVPQALAYGASAGLLASGGWDAVKGLLGGKG
jgi:hypothetical protein